MTKWFERKTPEGMLNQLTDEIWHKEAAKNPELWLIDFWQHVVIENDFKKSVRKALRYYPKRLLR